MCIRIERDTWSWKRCGQHEVGHRNRSDKQYGHRDMRRQLAPPCGRDDDRDAPDHGDDKCHRACCRGARIPRGVAEQERQQTPEQHHRAGEVTKAGFGQQVDRSGAQVRGDEEGADQIPGAVERLVPSERTAKELGPGADAVPDKTDPPDQLEAVPALPPLVQHHGREDEAQDRRAKRQHHIQHAHANASTIATLTSFKNQPTFRSRSGPPTLAEPISSTLDRTIPSNR